MVKRPRFSGMAAALAVGLACCPLIADADGPEDAYANGGAITRSQSGDVLNSEGVQLTPEEKMSDVAAAYRSGYNNRKSEDEAILKQRLKEQREADEQAMQGGEPPLPPDMQAGGVQAPPVRVAPVVTRPLPAPQYAMATPDQSQAQSTSRAPTVQYVESVQPYVQQQAQQYQAAPRYEQSTYAQPTNQQGPVYLPPVYEDAPVYTQPVVVQQVYQPPQVVVQPVVSTPVYAPVYAPVNVGAWAYGARYGYRWR